MLALCTKVNNCWLRAILCLCSDIKIYCGIPTICSTSRYIIKAIVEVLPTRVLFDHKCINGRANKRLLEGAIKQAICLMCAIYNYCVRVRFADMLIRLQTLATLRLPRDSLIINCPYSEISSQCTKTGISL